MMIDWLTVILPCNHVRPINSGEIYSVTSDGTVEWVTKKRLTVRGSYESNIIVRSVENTRQPDGSYSHLYIDGNFAKWHQGHNVFGTDDVIGLVLETFIKLVSILDLRPSDEDIHKVQSGDYQIVRIDTTRMVELGSLEQVRAFLYAAERTAYMRHRGRGVLTKDTLYFGKRSRRSTVKMYAKGDEIHASGHTPHYNIMASSIPVWASSKLRIEVTLRSMELKKIDLHTASHWGDNTPYEVWKKYVETIEMTDNIALPDDKVVSLNPRVRAAYQLWLDGHDVKSMFPTKTFYRYRKQLQAVGIDIAVQRSNSRPDTSNVIPFKRVIDVQACEQVPDWAIGTDLYFEPRQNLNV